MEPLGRDRERVRLSLFLVSFFYCDFFLPSLLFLLLLLSPRGNNNNNNDINTNNTTTTTKNNNTTTTTANNNTNTNNSLRLTTTQVKNASNRSWAHDPKEVVDAARSYLEERKGSVNRADKEANYNLLAKETRIPGYGTSDWSEAEKRGLDYGLVFYGYGSWKPIHQKCVPTRTAPAICAAARSRMRTLAAGGDVNEGRGEDGEAATGDKTANADAANADAGVALSNTTTSSYRLPEGVSLQVQGPEGREGLEQGEHGLWVGDRAVGEVERGEQGEQRGRRRRRVAVVAVAVFALDQPPFFVARAEQPR